MKVIIKGKVDKTPRIVFGNGANININKDSIIALDIAVDSSFINKSFALKFTNEYIDDFISSKIGLISQRLYFKIPSKILQYNNAIGVQLLIFDSPSDTEPSNTSNVNKQFNLPKAVIQPTVDTFTSAIETSIKGMSGITGDTDRILDEVQKFETMINFPIVGQAGIIYIDKSNNTTWRWDTEIEDYVSLGGVLTASNTSVTATPTNYTAATADVEAHLIGIDNALLKQVQPANTTGKFASIDGTTAGKVDLIGLEADDTVTSPIEIVSESPESNKLNKEIITPFGDIGTFYGGEVTPLATGIKVSAPSTTYSENFSFPLDPPIPVIANKQYTISYTQEFVISTFERGCRLTFTTAFGVPCGAIFSDYKADNEQIILTFTAPETAANMRIYVAGSTPLQLEPFEVDIIDFMLNEGEYLEYQPFSEANHQLTTLDLTDTNGDPITFTTGDVIERGADRQYYLNGTTQLHSDFKQAIESINTYDGATNIYSTNDPAPVLDVTELVVGAEKQPVALKGSDNKTLLVYTESDMVIDPVTGLTVKQQINALDKKVDELDLIPATNLILDTQGGDAVAGQVASFNYGDLPTPTRAGFSFLGWTLTPSGNDYITADDVVPKVNDLTLYAQWEQAPTDGLAYTYVAAIDGYEVSKGTVNSGAVIIADEFDDGTNGLKPVKRVAQNGFDFSGISSIYLPDTITVLRNNAFANCSSLTQANMPPYLTTIGSNAFVSTKITGELVIPNSVTSIGFSAFNSTLITSVKISTSLSNLDNQIFANTPITTVTIPANITSITGNLSTNGTFRNCSQLSEVIIERFIEPNTITTIGSNAFNGTGITASTGIIIVPVGSGDVYKTATHWVTFESQIVEAPPEPINATQNLDNTFTGNNEFTEPLKVAVGVANEDAVNLGQLNEIVGDIEALLGGI